MTRATTDRKTLHKTDMYQRQSPMQPLLSILNPTWEERFWTRVPVHFGNQEEEGRQLADLGLCDLSFLPKLGVKGRLADNWLDEQGMTTPADVYQVEQSHRDPLVARVDRNEFFLEDNLRGDRIQSLSEALGTGRPGTYRVNRQEASVLISGRRAPLILAQTCSYNFESAEEKLVMTRVAAVSCSVLRVRMGGTEGFRLWFNPAYGVYLWENLLAIVRDRGGSPVGVGCLLTR